MSEHQPLEQTAAFAVVRWRDGAAGPDTVRVATEVPLTVVANDIEIATISCTPALIPELVHGFLYTQGLIGGVGDVSSVVVDHARWRADAAIARTPDVGLLEKRLYTTGCGKGAQYATVFELAARRPLETGFRVPVPVLDRLMGWLLGASELHRETRGVHSAALAPEGSPPASPIDDIGRHNAVDKVIGRALTGGTDMASCVLASSGRVSSEILFKARRSGSR